MTKTTTTDRTLATETEMISMEPGRWLHDDRYTIIKAYGLHMMEPQSSFERAAADLAEVAATMGVSLCEEATARYLRAVVYDLWLGGQADLTLADLDQ